VLTASPKHSRGFCFRLKVSQPSFHTQVQTTIFDAPPAVRTTRT
jgi:hypothetical protein